MSLDLARQPLRKAVESELVERLHHGGLGPGDRINVSQLADELEISRTPLREALLELSFRGFLSPSTNRGFFVRDLDPAEAKQLYELTGILECRAVQETEEFAPEQLEKLQELNEKRHAVMDTPNEAVALDTAWHRALTEQCHNTVLLELLTYLKDRLYRYEYSYAADADRIERSTQQHQEILEALQEDIDGEHKQACHLLDKHWKSYGDLMRRQLDSESGGSN